MTPFNDVDNSSMLLKRVVENRVSEAQAADVVLTNLMTQYEFGRTFFHKILDRSILKPSSSPQGK